MKVRMLTISLQVFLGLMVVMAHLPSAQARPRLVRSRSTDTVQSLLPSKMRRQLDRLVRDPYGVERQVMHRLMRSLAHSPQRPPLSEASCERCKSVVKFAGVNALLTSLYVILWSDTYSGLGLLDGDNLPVFDVDTFAAFCLLTASMEEIPRKLSQEILEGNVQPTRFFGYMLALFGATIAAGEGMHLALTQGPLLQGRWP